MDRLVLLVPPDPVALVPRPPEHLQDLAAPRLAATDQVDLEPVAGTRGPLNVRCHEVIQARPGAFVIRSRLHGHAGKSPGRR
jgi:hypothetical protein